MTILECRHLGKRYRTGSGVDVLALNDVSLAVPARSFTLLTGPSGSGKTTLLAMLGGLERPTKGQVYFGGRELSRCSSAELTRLRRRMGFVFQDFALIAGLPAWENVTYPLVPRGTAHGERFRLAQELLARFGLGNRLAARPRELSGGEQQRVAIARALAGRPEVVLADEPTSNLDDEAAQGVIQSLQQIHSEGTTLVVSSHDRKLMDLATQVFRLESGHLKSPGR